MDSINNRISIDEYKDKISAENYEKVGRIPTGTLKLIDAIKTRAKVLWLSEDEFGTLLAYMAYETVRRIPLESYIDDLIKVFKKVPMPYNWLDALMPLYNNKIFNEYNLLDDLKKLVINYGYDDILFNSFIKRVKIIRATEKEKYVEESTKLSMLTSYSDNFIAKLKMIMVNYYVDFDEILLSLPDSKLISEDEYQASIINKLYGAGTVKPLSYEYMEYYLKGVDFDYLSDDVYYDTLESKVKASFTLSELKNSFLKNDHEVKQMRNYK